MFQLLKTWRRAVTVGVLLLLASLIWISNLREEKDRNVIDRTVVTMTAPLQSAIDWVFDGVGEIWHGYVYFVGLRESHDALLAENDRLRGALALAQETAIENERLRRMLEFPRENAAELVAASVIGSDAASFAKSIRINRGSSHGVARNMAVVTPGGVVGRVVEVSAFHADVQLLTDGRSAVPVRVQRTRAQGVLEGLSKGLCHLKYVARAEDVQRGDVVVTSGLGGIFPHGLVVGTVVSVDKKEFGVLQEVRVAPAVDFRRLPEEVLVVKTVPGIEEAGAPAAAIDTPGATTAAADPGGVARPTPRPGEE